jgi:hypothetical protein
MSRKGNPYDNAFAESFMKTLKSEEVHLWEYRTMEDAQRRIPYFIEDVYIHLNFLLNFLQFHMLMSVIRSQGVESKSYLPQLHRIGSTIFVSVGSSICC